MYSKMPLLCSSDPVLLARSLEKLTLTYHHPRHLGSDPLIVVRRFAGRPDREMAAFFAALLSYGRVEQINRALEDLFDRMNQHPGAFVMHFNNTGSSERLLSFKHRFTDGEDIGCLCWLMQQVLAKGTLEDFFMRGHRREEPDIADAAGRFIRNFIALKFGPNFSRKTMLRKSSFKHLLPDPARGSACKRLFLFLRWVARPDDGIDLGLWKKVPPSKLLMPIDTHIMRIGRRLGMLNVKTPSLAAARQMTRCLRQIDPDDPVRFDFSLCRLGIKQVCSTDVKSLSCDVCDMAGVCAVGASD